MKECPICGSEAINAVTMPDGSTVYVCQTCRDWENL